MLISGPIAPGLVRPLREIRINVRIREDTSANENGNVSRDCFLVIKPDYLSRSYTHS